MGISYTEQLTVFRINDMKEIAKSLPKNAYLSNEMTRKARNLR